MNLRARFWLILVGVLVLAVACGPAPRPSETAAVDEGAGAHSESDMEGGEMEEGEMEEPMEGEPMDAEMDEEPMDDEEMVEEPLEDDALVDENVIPAEIEFELTEEGSGTAVASGDWVSVHFVAYLSDGTEFFSTHEISETLVFPHDTGAMMPGLDMAVGRMKVGDKATAVIPPELAFGAQGNGQIPPNETLTFDLELVDIPDIEMEILEEGEGEFPQVGDLITAHYRGTLEDGTEFDSSYDNGQPFQFVLGVGQVIPGWDMAFARLKPGGSAVLTVPPELAYGAQGRPGIPGGATLTFEVELLEVEVQN